ncbi:MAG: SDR family oxidoreductase [Cytophagales bacterium]|nr:MAG: SDR family oxidoreductase [Cytophagales bacterium]
MKAQNKILITGSNGLLGQKLVNIISQDSNYELIATARGVNRLPNDGSYIYEQMDITNELEVTSIINKYQPNYVIHTAAMTNVDQCETEKTNCWDQNVNAVSYIVSACETNNCHLIHLSTDFIFDGISGPYNEGSTAHPLSYYGESKLKAEEIILSSKIKFAIARTVLVYGIAHDMSRTNIILWVKKNLEEGKKINVVDDQERSPTLAEDLAVGCFLLVKHNSEGIYNIAGDEILTPYQMAITTADFFNLNKELINKTDSTNFKQLAVRPLKTGLIITKAKNELGYKPHSFEKGIALIASQI